jgi:hypothetical protein
MERDILLDRLEKKLAEKEKELEELRKMVSSDTLEELKREIIEEINREFDFKGLEAKVKELSKAVENLLSEIVYIKSELRRSEERRRDLIEIKGDDEIITADVQQEEKKDDEPSDEEIIIVD